MQFYFTEIWLPIIKTSHLFNFTLKLLFKYEIRIDGMLSMKLLRIHLDKKAGNNRWGQYQAKCEEGNECHYWKQCSKTNELAGQRGGGGLFLLTTESWTAPWVIFFFNSLSHPSWTNIYLYLFWFVCVSVSRQL